MTKELKWKNISSSALAEIAANPGDLSAIRKAFAQAVRRTFPTGTAPELLLSLVISQPWMPKHRV